MKPGKQTLPFPKNLRNDVNSEFAKNIMKKLFLASNRPVPYQCQFCNGYGYLEGRLNNYECHDCGGLGGPPMTWYDLKGRPMTKKEENGWWG
ncbi:MAG: hypothetical protein MN733_22815 [Nitrososphaera sp.]|nr:hypothetical protein [Nitrososphaera sp.]